MRDLYLFRSFHLFLLFRGSTPSVVFNTGKIWSSASCLLISIIDSDQLDLIFAFLALQSNHITFFLLLRRIRLLHQFLYCGLLYLNEFFKHIWYLNWTSSRFWLLSFLTFVYYAVLWVRFFALLRSFWWYLIILLRNIRNDLVILDLLLISMTCIPVLSSLFLLIVFKVIFSISVASIPIFSSFLLLHLLKIFFFISMTSIPIFSLLLFFPLSIWFLFFLSINHFAFPLQQTDLLL